MSGRDASVRAQSPTQQPPAQLKSFHSSWASLPNSQGLSRSSPAPEAPSCSSPVLDAPALARPATALQGSEPQANPSFTDRSFSTSNHHMSFPSLNSHQGHAGLSHHHSNSSLPNSHPLQHQLSQAGFNRTAGQTHFGQHPSQHAGQGVHPLPQGNGTPHLLGGYSQAQLQAMLANCMRRDEHKEEAVLGAASQDYASISRWLQQAHDVAGKPPALALLCPYPSLY